MRELVVALRSHQLDVVLANSPVASDASGEPGTAVRSHLLDEQPVSLVGPAGKRRRRFRFPESVAGQAIVLPGPESAVRQGFDQLCEESGVEPRVMAEVDDMALLRLLARDSGDLALVPVVVVADELRQKHLVELHRFAELKERFYAIVPRRRFFHPQLARLLPEGRSRN
jgi:LysR family transcriptional activator of nhaA